MNATQKISPYALQPDETNLSSWTVKFERAMLGWSWSAEHADGRTAAPSVPGIFAKKANAEIDAVKQMTAVECGEGDETINGFDLQIRVREQERAET